MSNRCRQKLKNGGYIVGSWIQIPHPVSVEIMAHAGFDFLTIDLEHGAVDIETATNLFRAIEATNRNVIPMVRLPGNDYSITKRYIDAGAKGIFVPLVNSREDAEEAVRSAKYPPEGERGVGFCRANLYGIEFDQYMEEANDDILIVVQIEHVKAVENIEEILTTPGIDGAFIGPYDLSASMGIPGDLNHVDMQDAMERVLESCKKHNVAPGLHIISPQIEEINKRLEQGYRLIAYSLDTVMLTHICKDVSNITRWDR